MRQPRRTNTEKIEDVFFDLDAQEQESLLSALQTLHRLKMRQVERAVANDTPLTEKQGSLGVAQ